MSNKARLGFYALGSMAALIWLVQSVVQSMQDGTLWSFTNIVFLLCLLVAVFYFLVSAILLWKRGNGDTGKDGEAMGKSLDDGKAVVAGHPDEEQALRTGHDE